MNPAMSLLQPYPFEQLAKLFAGITPPKDLHAITLSIGKPWHSTPGFIAD
jgi:N-succinyldiaminopimelate aminotransferase